MPHVHCPSCRLTLTLARGSVGGACPRCLARRGEVVFLLDRSATMLAGDRPRRAAPSRAELRPESPGPSSAGLA